jgi:DNA-binding GntR family transcriptional regulator
MLITFKTKNEAVYEKLRKEIIEGRLKPGERITFSKLSKKYGLSETPIREAVKKLESEGLLFLTPHVGAIVSKIDPEEIIEFYLIRMELESLATKLAISYITDSEIEDLCKNIQESEAAILKNQYENLGKLNKEFHLAIYRSAPFPHLFKLIVELWEKVHRIRSVDGVFIVAPERARESLEEHKKIVDAIKQKNAGLAAELVKKQKQNSLMAIAKFLGKTEEDPRFL